ncbi:MAG: hypothetical protein MI724_00685, partial [Spirochaetales bacterium]|nr:hypothetical protein [Spirochaetales bacterium]
LRIAVPVRSGFRVGKTIHVTVLAVTPSLRLKRVYPNVSAAATAASAASDDAVAPVGRTLIDRFLHAHRLFGTPGSYELVRALVASERHLAPESVHHLTTLFALLTRRADDEPHRPRRRAALARALVELHDRSIAISEPATPAQIDLVRWLVDGSESGHGDNRGDSQRRESRTRGTAGDLSAYLNRATGTPDHPLQLFNALATTGDLHWIVIPIGATSGSGLSEARVEGTLKLAVSRATGAVEGALLTVTSGRGRWRFSWRLDNGQPTLYRATGDEGAPSIPEALLARLGVTRHTGRVAHDGDDGFTIGTIEDGHMGVDQYG